jgi:hypothetical protein
VVAARAAFREAAAAVPAADFVFLDESGATTALVRRYARAEGAGCRLLLLPPYSPDFNPIEQAWSTLKTLAPRRGRPHPRGAGGRARDVPRRDHRDRRAGVDRPLRLPHCRLI